MLDMSFDDFCAALVARPLLENRGRKSKYCEVVVSAAEMPALRDFLAGVFAAPCKPEGVKASAEMAAWAAQYGGIQINQVMYMRKHAQGREFVFLWPWSSGQAVTVKSAREEEKDS